MIFEAPLNKQYHRRNQQSGEQSVAECRGVVISCATQVWTSGEKVEQPGALMRFRDLLVSQAGFFECAQAEARENSALFQDGADNSADPFKSQRTELTHEKPTPNGIRCLI